MFVGIDPGLDGAIAIYSPAIKAKKEAPAMASFLACYDMPTVPIEVGGKLRRKVDVHGLDKLFADLFFLGAPEKVMVELVGGRKGDSAASAFTFGYGVGLLHAALGLRKIGFTLVASTVWKKAVKAPADKKVAVTRADELLPGHMDAWRPKDAKGKETVRPDRAEAALVAYYASTL